jgi:hypothetical protein
MPDIRAGGTAARGGGQVYSAGYILRVETVSSGMGMTSSILAAI